MKGAPVFITAAVRTPIGSFGGGLKPLSAPQLGAIAAKACIERAGLDGACIDQVIFGHARQAGTGPNPARQVGFAANIPVEKPATTINQACNSGLRAVMSAALAVLHEGADIVLAGGMESMSNTPYLLPNARWGMPMGHGDLVDGMYRDGFLCPLCNQVMGETAENLVDDFNISRREQDEFAARSQQRCEAAQARGLFNDEMAAVTVVGKKGEITIERDEHPRSGVTADSLSKLKPVFRKSGTVHAGNACGMADGAAAVLVCSEAGLKKISGAAAHLSTVRLVDWTVEGVDPARMGIGPVAAVRKLLAKTKLTLEQMDLIELNEAFAAQVIACDRELKFNAEQLNVNGGAIALGHPIGATGARILVTLMHEMRRRGSKRGLATLCVSGGLGGALMVERV